MSFLQQQFPNPLQGEAPSRPDVGGPADGADPFDPAGTGGATGMTIGTEKRKVEWSKHGLEADWTVKLRDHQR